MKGLWITLGAVAVVAGVAYFLKDNEQVKGALDKINEKANDTLGKLNDNWKKATDQFNKKTAALQS